MFIHTRSICLHQDPWILVLTSGLLFSQLDLWVSEVLCCSMWSRNCSWWIVFNPNPKDCLTQLLFDIFGFRKDRSYIVIIVPFILFLTLKNTENFIFMIDIIHAVCVCAKWNTFELLWMWSHEQPMDVFIFICGIEIHVYFLYNYYLHLIKMFIVWLPSAYSLNHYIYNQTVLPVNVLLSFQEIFLPNTCFVCNVVYLNLHEIWCKLCTFKLKYFNCSSPQLVWGVLTLKYHLQKNILNPLLF